MLFWGITLWLPLVVKSLGFHGMASGYASALPYLLAVILAIPMAIISDRTAIGPAAGIVNGIGAGIGGVLSGWIVGLLKSSTGSYLPGFVVLGIISVLGGLSLIVYGRLASRHVATHKGTALQH